MHSSRVIIQKKTFNILEKFALESVVSQPAVHMAANTLLRSLQTFDHIEEKEQHIKVHELRKLFLDTYLDQTLPVIFLEHIDFKKLIYNILIEMAEAFPVNDIDSDTQLPIDPISTLPIKKNDTFCTITGHIFNINTLIDYNEIRPIRYNATLHERNGKFLLNPFTNQPFLPMDMERLIVIAVKKGKKLDFLIDELMDSRSRPAELSRRFSLKDIASVANNGEIDLNLDITTEFIFTLTDVIACMAICYRNNEMKPFEHYNNIQQTFALWLTQPEESKINYSITQPAANAFVCMLTAHNEYKTLREIIEQQIGLGLGFDLNHQYKGVAAIHLAAEIGATESMEVLLDPKYNVDVNLRDSTGSTAARIAARYNNTALIKMLAERGANLMIPGFDGEAPIHIAAENNNIELMTLLFAYHVNLNQIKVMLNIDNQAGLTAAYRAAEKNSLQVIIMLLEAGADFNIINSDGFSPIHAAAYFGSIEVMRLLLQHKDRIVSDQILQNHVPVACLAAQNGHVEILELLAESKVALDLPKKDDGTTPLHLAVLKNHYAASEFLVKHYLANHINIFVRHTAGQSPFLFACANRNWDIAKLFLYKIPVEDIPPDDKELIELFHEELGIPKNVFSATTLDDLAAIFSLSIPDNMNRANHVRFFTMSEAPSEIKESKTDNWSTALMNNGLFCCNEQSDQNQQLLPLTQKTEAPIRQVMK